MILGLYHDVIMVTKDQIDVGHCGDEQLIDVGVSCFPMVLGLYHEVIVVTQNQISVCCCGGKQLIDVGLSWGSITKSLQ